MRNFWLIARHEYLNRVRRRSFLLASLGIPIGIALIMTISIVSQGSASDPRPLGLIDQAGVVTNPEFVMLDAVEMQQFEREDEADAALQLGEIQGYVLIPESFLLSAPLQYSFWDQAPDDDLISDLNQYLRTQLLSNYPDDIQTLMLTDPILTIRSADGQREINSEGALLSILIPYFASFIFYLAMVSSGGYLLQAVSDEKENRTIEVMITSVRPEELIAGKAIGLLAVGLTQLLIWILVLVAIILAGPSIWEGFQLVQIPWSFLGIVLIFFLPTSILIAGIMIAIGGMVEEASQGQQISGFINMLFMSPWFFSILFFTSPDSPLAVILTLIPFTAFLSTALRWSLSVVPLWQLIASWTILSLTAGGAVWAAARIFRLGMLRYGKRIRLIVAIRHLFNPGESQAPMPDPQEIGHA
jgi:ABC-2 type transport system permease protein